MDLHLAKSSNGKASRLTAIAAALCFVLAGAFLVASLAGPRMKGSEFRSNLPAGPAQFSMVTTGG